MAKRGGFPGMGGANMANIMKQAQKMQRQMQEAQKEIEEMLITTTSGGGAVEVTINGSKQITDIKLSKDAVDPDDVEMLQDLIMAAVNEAIRELEEKSQSKMAGFTGGFGGLGF